MRFNQTMKAKAKAKWDKNKACWIVSVSLKDISYDDGKKRQVRRSKGEYCICLCDEAVIPSAILEENGINSKLLFTRVE